MATKLCIATSGLLRVLSGAATTITPPSLPSILGITPGPAQVTVQWAAPVSDGGSPLTSYTVTVSPGSHVVGGINPGTFTQAVTGLTNGVAYTATVTAANAVGSSTSAVSATVTPLASLAPRPSPNITGVPQGLPGDTRTPVTLTRYTGARDAGTGTIRLATPGVTYNGILFDALVTLTAVGAGLTFNGCRFKPPQNPAGGVGAVACINGSNAGIGAPTFNDCEFDGNGVWADTWGGVQGQASGSCTGSSIGFTGNSASLGYTMNRCYVHGFDDCVDISGAQNVVLDSCYMTDPVQFFNSSGSVSHNDVIQFFTAGGVSIQITNNVLDNYNHTVGKRGNTSAIQWGAAFNNGAPLHNILIDGNFLDGGGYIMNGLGRADTIGKTDMVNVTFTNNRFGLNTTFGTVTPPSHDPRVTWANNVYDVSGSNHGTLVVAGQLIP